MADPLTYLKQRSKDDWLIGYNSQFFGDLAEQRLEELRSRPQPGTPLTVLLAEREPLRFLAYFIAACAANCRIFLANPDWAEAEWQQVAQLVVPDVVWGEVVGVGSGKGGGRKEAGGVGEAEVAGEGGTAETQRHGGMETQNSSLQIHTLHPTPYTLHPLPLTPHILIPTGGTSGSIRFAIHTWDTLMASVEGFCQYFEVEQVNSFCVLPLYHVSGLMQFLRSFTTGGKLVAMPFKSLETGAHSAIKPEAFFLSLVPTQLQRLFDRAGSEGKTAETQRRREVSFVPNSTLEAQNSSIPYTLHPTPHSPIAWLSRFHTILLGGAPAWSDVLDRARKHRLRLAPTYGMTETASQIATLKPDDFLNGHTNVGHVLPHAQVTIRNPSGEILPPHQSGTVTIQANSLFYGYYPDDRTPTESSEKHRSNVAAPINHRSTASLSPPQDSCSEGLGELGPQKAGDWGEDPQRQSSNEAEMLAHHSLKQGEQSFQPDDLGFFDTNGYLHIVGRQTDKIITGGENVFPAEVEAVIRSTGLVQDVCVIGVSDRHWGQAIVAVYVPMHTDTAVVNLQIALEEKLSKFKRPKHWLALDQLPRNAQGKVSRSHVDAIAKQALSIVPAID